MTPDIPADAAQAAPVLGEEEREALIAALELVYSDHARHREQRDETCGSCRWARQVAEGHLDTIAPAVGAILAARLGQQDDQQAADRAAVEAVARALETCRCSLQYPGFDRSPFVNRLQCPAHGADHTGLRRDVTKALDAAREPRSESDG